MAERKKSVHQPRINARAPVATHGGHTPVRGIIHETISHNVPGTSDMTGVAGFWNRQGLGYGAHLGIDEEGQTCKYASEHAITWHTGGRNTGSLGIEIVSMKWMSKLAWWKKVPKELHKLAKWMAWYNKEFGIPLRWDVNSGWSTHYMQSKAFGTTDHTDGQFLPKRRVMRLAKKYRREGW
jgi:N-acetyl-anhydromuramyl-L-alanine amidase AmpD